MTPQAYSPASVTCFFQPCPGPTPEATVSRGCAICLDRGVAAAVAPTTARTHSVRLNGRPIGIAAVHDVLSHLALSPTLVELESPLPIGCGFGVSAAAALATAFALERRFESGRTREDLARIAHTADVVNRTGIGDVGAQLAGGVVHRRGRTGPFDCERLDVLDRSLFVRVFGPLATADVLASPAILEAIRREGAAALEWWKPCSTGH
jgi:pantoate kinase